MSEFIGLRLPLPDVSESDTEDVWRQWDEAMHLLIEAQAKAERDAQAQLDAALSAEAEPTEAPDFIGFGPRASAERIAAEVKAQALARGHTQAITEMVKRHAPPAKGNLH